MAGTPDSLAVELAYYERNLSDLLERLPGKFVLIKGEELIGFFDTAEAAYTAGMERLGLTPFFIRQVLPKEIVYDIPALRHGLINARS